MTAFPIWFGPEDMRLFGFLHLPEHAAGGFVLCPPIGNDNRPGYRGFTLLAEHLAAAGFVVLRFDYTGTGDSAGTPEDVPGVETWARDIEAAVALVRSTGVSDVGLVGLRIGALLAAHVAPRVSPHVLALWDPCVSGRRYLREQRLLSSVMSGSDEAPRDPAGSMEIPSMQLTTGLASSLRALELVEHGGPLAPRVLVLARSGSGDDDVLRERLSTSDVAFEDAPEQHAFLEAKAPYTPAETLERLSRWCVGALLGAKGVPVAPMAPPGAWGSAVVTGWAGGHEVVERPVTIDPGGLFGIVSEPPGGAEAGGAPGAEAGGGRETAPAILLLSLGGDRRTGPSRMWVDLGRSWAAKGLRVLRLDLSGIGDSAASPGATRYDAYPPGGVGDVVVAARYLAPDDPSRVVLVGVCSGAYHAADAAVVLKSRAVWLLNPAVPIASTFRDAPTASAAQTWRRAVRRADPISRRLIGRSGAVHLAHRLMPGAAWWLLDRLGLYTYAIRAFDPLLEQGTETFLVCGGDEAVPYVGRGRLALRARQRSGLLHLEVVDSLDHALMLAGSRREITRRLDDYVFGSADS
ncbi:MAG TPA: alpha/beta hydrolase family protein [Acidimicrobiales bacterium]|nr:alpha/beta hydrolase family protein [Acidimicrobiales bacterium]